MLVNIGFSKHPPFFIQTLLLKSGNFSGHHSYSVLESTSAQEQARTYEFLKEGGKGFICYLKFKNLSTQNGPKKK